MKESTYKNITSAVSAIPLFFYILLALVVKDAGLLSDVWIVAFVCVAVIQFFLTYISFRVLNDTIKVLNEMIFKIFKTIGSEENEKANNESCE